MIENNAAGKAIGYQPDEEIHLVRNPNWDKSTDFKPAYLDEIDNRRGQRRHDRRRAARSSPARAWSTATGRRRRRSSSRCVELDQKDQLVIVPGGGDRYVAMNTKVKPFDDINVRKAVIAGFDREALRLTRGGALVADMPTHFIPPGIAGFDEAGGMDGPGYDFLNNPAGRTCSSRPSTSRRRASPSGKYNGPTTPDGRHQRRASAPKAAEVAKEHFEQLGFKVKSAPGEARTRCTPVTAACPGAKVAVCPNVGWMQGLRGRPDDPGPDVQRQEHPRPATRTGRS